MQTFFCIDSLSLKDGALPSIRFQNPEEAEATPTPKKKKTMAESEVLGDRERRQQIRQIIAATSEA